MIIRYSTNHAPILAPKPGVDGVWLLERHFTVVEDNTVQWTVPHGMETDGASIPRAFWRVVGHPFDSEIIYAALLHDAAYQGRLMRDGLPAALTRAEADALFLAVMTGITVGNATVSVSWIMRKLIYRAVRMFGGSSFVGVK